MQRSSSMTRVADEYYKNQLSSSTPATGPDGNSGNNLPVYTPSRKDKYRLRSPENAVHLIPLVLFLCALVLWFFSSNPVEEKGSNKINLVGFVEHLQLGVDAVNKNHGGIVGNVNGLKDTVASSEIDGTFLPHIEIDDVNILHHHIHHHRHTTELEEHVF